MLELCRFLRQRRRQGHLTKRSEGADLLDRISGSLAFGAAPRGALLSVTQKTASGPRGVLTKVKISNGKEWGGYDFTAETRPLDGDPSVSGQRILWGAFIDEEPRAIVAKIEGAAERAGQTMRKAVAFVRDALKRGPRLAAEVIGEGEASGFSKRTLQRAFTGKDIGGRPEKAGFDKGGAAEIVFVFTICPSLASIPPAHPQMGRYRAIYDVKRDSRKAGKLNISATWV